MRELNFIDFVGQSIIIGWALLSAVYGAMTDQSNFINTYVTPVALYLGLWQVVSTVISILGEKRFLKWRCTHLFASIFYLMGLGMYDFHVVVVYGVPAILAILCYTLTIKLFLTNSFTIF